MSRAVVHNPKDAASGPVGLLVHDFADEAIHRSNSSLYFTAAENLGPMDIPSCQVGPSALAKVQTRLEHACNGSGRERTHESGMRGGAQAKRRGTPSTPMSTSDTRNRLQALSVAQQERPETVEDKTPRRTHTEIGLSASSWRRFLSAVRTQVFTVPSGWPMRSAISDCESPSKYASSIDR